MDKIKAYNQRQINLMEDQITKFKKGDLSMYNLISNLYALLKCINETEALWCKAVSPLVGNLDTINAIALDRQQADFSPLQLREINQHIAEILKLIVIYRKENFLEFED